MPKLSIIILTFNSFRFIKPCLDSIFVQEYLDFEVILVDNGSKDNSVSFIRKNYPRIRLIENKQNLGTCKARNQAAEICQGEWVLTLDSDIILDKDFLTKIMRFARESENSVGMLQPKILREDKKTIYSCGIFLSKSRRFYDIGKGKFDNVQFNTTKYIFGVCSAAALYRRKCLEEIKEDTGYFDERFFFLVEDVDLAWRAQKISWKTLYYPEAVCYHFGNSSNYDKQLRQYLCFRNRCLMILKNEKFWHLVKYTPYFLIYDIPRFLYLLFINKYVLKYKLKILPN
jgi:GT2 family glycosyltransferase